MSAVRTFGTATLRRAYNGTSVWFLKVEPHVSMRLKRLFHRIQNMGEHGLALTATDENSRELEWFAQRYPLVFERVADDGSPADGRAALEQRARAFDERAARAHAIISGKYTLPDLRLALPPREYQQIAATLLLTSGSLLLADEVGLGKTVSAIAVLSDPKTLPALIVTPAHLPLQWSRELQRFLPGIKVHIAKKARPYALDEHLFGAPDVLIMSYWKMNGWAEEIAGKYRTVVFDECQELRHTGTDRHRAAETIAAAADFRLGLSATPIYNYGDEFHSVFSVLRPDALGTHSEFVSEWCVRAPGEKSKIKDPVAFGTYVRETGLMLRRTRVDVQRELPPVNRVVHEVETDRAELAKSEANAVQLARLIVGRDASNFDRLKASSEFSMWLRQATGIDKAPYVAGFARMLLEQEPREPLVIFGWHRTVYDIWIEALQDFKPALYTGSESPAQKALAAQRFIDGDTDLLLVSLRSGSGLDGLQKRCSRVLIGELDWSPGAIEQCIGRVYRDGQVKPVFAYYLVSTDGADPTMIDVLGVKRHQIESVRDPAGAPTEIREVEAGYVKRLAEDYLRRKRRATGMELA